MGVALTYRSSSKLEPKIKEALLAEAAALRETRRWWCEPIGFLESPGEELLGFTKIFNSGYSDSSGRLIQVDNADDFLMAWNDCRVISEILAEWSKRFAMGWSLLLEEQPIGEITSTGEFSRELQATLADLLKMARAPTNEEARTRLVAEIDEKYASRRGV